MLDAGTKAPDFAVQDNSGKTVRLSDFKGKSVLLWFYPMADTPGCTKEGCSFRDLNAEFQKKGVQVLGVSFDEVKDNDAFAKKFHFNFPLLSDTKREIGMAYGATDDPKAKTATRISYLIGPDGVIKKAYPKVKAAEHPAEVMSEL